MQTAFAGGDVRIDQADVAGAELVQGEGGHGRMFAVSGQGFQCGWLAALGKRSRLGENANKQCTSSPPA